eukprot:TRINITY_DN9593_c0_g1_i1.p1 TRINITY_DN9593_c0_g1~~TRINITY_DN9593_c0_g1_i1.p1  ORF type:complete len:568 (-),score=107.07 TRINITY_DN9593_c0_g1_i1:21-1724(-)
MELGAEIRPEEVKKISGIGAGASAEVFRGTCRGADCAIKVLFRQDLTTEDLEAFRDEVSVMSKLIHPNVVLFMGACTQPGKLMIVTELLPMDLDTLFIKKKANYPLIQKLGMARDAALGMNWLHRNKPQFIHRDLKLSNLLVTEDHKVKVCDFGLVRIRHDIKREEQGAQGSPLYMAPEVFIGTWDEKCDLYSFGLLLWEMIYQKQVFPHYSNQLAKLIIAVCDAGERPPITDEVPPRLADLMRRCWADNPRDRPTFAKVVKDLDEIMIELSIADPKGQALWKENFHSDYSIPLDSLFNVLPKYAQKTKGDKSDQNYRALKSLLVQSSGPNMSDIVTIERFGQVLDWFGPINSSKGFLNKISSVLRQKWFHGDLNQTEAEARLSMVKTGGFLIRFSSNQKRAFTLSCRDEEGSLPAHYRIVHKPSSEVFYFWDEYTKKEKSFPDLPTLIESLKETYNLKTACAGSPFSSIFQEIDPDSLGYDKLPPTRMELRSLKPKKKKKKKKAKKNPAIDIQEVAPLKPLKKKKPKKVEKIDSPKKKVEKKKSQKLDSPLKKKATKKKSKAKVEK